MEQRTGRSDCDVGGHLLECLHQCDAFRIVVAPDVAAIDHACEERGACCYTMVFDGLEVLVTPFDEVESHPVEFEELHCFVNIGYVAEIRVEQHPDTAVPRRQQTRIERFEQRDVTLVLVEHQIWFVELHPLRAQLGEAPENLGVHVGHGIHEPLVDGELLGLGIAGEFEEGVWADEHRLRLYAQRLRLQVLIERFRAVEPHLGGGVEFGHQVMVVRGEPFLHGQCGHIATLTLVPAGHGEQCLLRVVKTKTTVSGRNHIEQDRGVEHLVVQ